MSGAINPYSNDLNYVVANGVRSPGRAQLTEVGAQYNWQVQEAYGMSAGSTTFRGKKLARFTLTIALWLPEHFALWPVFKKALEPGPATAQGFAVGMQHPLLASADINAVCVESLSEPVRQPNGGPWLATIKLLEYRKPIDALAKIDKSIPAPDKGKPVTPKTELDRVLIEEKNHLANAITAGRIQRGEEFGPPVAP